MPRFTEGDRVRIDIPDETDPDYEYYHGVYGTIVETLGDDADTVTRDEREGIIFRAELAIGEMAGASTSG